MNPDRILTLRKGLPARGPVLYWMSREQRCEDNWALLHARDLAEQSGVPLLIAFCLVPVFNSAIYRSWAFMLRGLAEVEEHLAAKGFPLYLLRGEPGSELPKLIKSERVSMLVADMDPLREKRAWLQQVVAQCDIPCHLVDAHNIVPVWRASPKAEFAARTIRPRLLRALPAYLEPFPVLREQSKRPAAWPQRVDWKSLLEAYRGANDLPELSWLIPGENAARLALELFIGSKLEDYDTARNDPTRDGQSHLSPYLHFGQLAPQRAAWETEQADAPPEARGAFLEELVVRRELSDNYCWYNQSYGTFDGLPAWAQRTLNAHRGDPRAYLYSFDELEQARTHDPLWNAAQRELLRTGKMHGYLRMYWAKKVMEWSVSPEAALNDVIRLNDTYSLDGRDPNGYVGAAWAVGGLHDRPWMNRPVFGQIRYMNYEGCRRKFDVDKYIRMQG